ncbi:MAG: hypothetical protein JSV49_11480 [Thermoplasmata archaeon]|nr:MAG: hypothetical protein JSV49_11480 [Thermoplasmata archaeon]
MASNRKGNVNVKGSQETSNVELQALTDIWQDFSNSMGNQLLEIMKDNQSEYEKLHGTWTDLSSKFGARVSENIRNGNKEYTELYNVWKNYANKFSTRLTRIGNNGGIDYDTLIKNWENYTKKINLELFSDVKDGNIHTIFSIWDNFYRNMTHQMDEMMKNGTTINNDLSQTWNDFSSRMTTILDTLSSDSVDIKDLNRDWKNFSIEVNRGLSKFIKNYEGDFTKLQNEWVKNTERVGETLTDTFDLISESYGEIYQRYFEWSAPYLKNIEAYSKTRVKSLEQEISELKARLDNLESKK